MYLVIGLGNPGRQYEGTRHNLGFAIVDAVADVVRCEFRPGRGDYWAATCSLNNRDVALLKPTTFMNDSGIAVVQALEHYQALPRELLVVSDDFQLPLGTLRLRPRGSDGGHNGMASIIYHLQSDEFARLRCGIGSAFMPGDKSSMTQFVLDRFQPEELPEVRALVLRARDACISVVSEGLGPTMSRFNTPRDRNDS